MLDISRQVEAIEISPDERLLERLKAFKQPVVLKGLVAQWPAVKAEADMDSYLRQFVADVPIQSMCAEPQANGRYFYNDDFSGFNFTRSQTHLKTLLDAVKSQAPAGLYMGSTTLDYCLPGFSEHNILPLDPVTPLVSAWIGNQTRVAAHFDVPQNIACVVSGKRRFILFPPEQLDNLYVGPLKWTPAGQPISLVDFHHVDYDRFPRFRQALAHAQIAELSPGDAIYIPSMWWHHVEALGQLNVLINYWWRPVEAFYGQPLDALNHAIVTIRDLPQEQRQALKALFEYYVFEHRLENVEHIPADVRGMLGDIDANQARRIRAELLQKLNR